MHTSPRRLLACILLAALTACGGGGGSSGGGGGGGSLPGTTTIDMSFIGGAPTALAVKLGSGAFVSAPAASALQVNVPSGTTTYQVAVACQAAGMGTINQETVYQFAVSDGMSFTLEPCYVFPAATATITGSFDVSAIPGATAASIVGANFNSTYVAATTGTFSLNTVSGTNDVAVVALSSTSKALAVKFVRAQTAPGSVSGSVTLSAADELVPTGVTINGIPAGWSLTPAINPTVVTANKTAINLPSTSPNQYMALAGADAIASDYYQINSNDAGGPGSSSATSNTIYTPGGVAILNLPAPLAYSGPTPAAWPTFALSYSSYSGFSAVNYLGQISWPVSPTAQDELDVYATAAFLGSTTNVVVPDLSAYTGFYNHAASGATINWYAAINAGVTQSFLNNQNSGQSDYVSDRGTYVEP